jgi:hypothetical protein
MTPTNYRQAIAQCLRDIDTLTFDLEIAGRPPSDWRPDIAHEAGEPARRRWWTVTHSTTARREWDLLEDLLSHAPADLVEGIEPDEPFVISVARSRETPS